MKQKKVKSNRKWVVIFMVLMIAPFVAKSQQFDVGVRGGYTGIALYNSDLVKVSDMQTGFSAGAYGAYELGPITLSLDILYSRMRTTELAPEFLYSVENSLPGNDVVVNTAPIFNTLELPLLANYYFYKGDKMSLRASAGPVFNFNLKNLSRNTYINVFDNGVAGEVEKEGINSKIKMFEIGACVGLGSDFDAGDFVYSVDLRYQMGFSEITDEVESKVLLNNDLTRHGLFFLVGVGYRLGFRSGDGGSISIGEE